MAGVSSFRVGPQAWHGSPLSHSCAHWCPFARDARQASPVDRRLAHAYDRAVPTWAYATPEVLRWARETAGLSVLDAAARAHLRGWSKLEAAEEGADLITLRELERLATVYDRDLALFFCSRHQARNRQRRSSGASQGRRHRRGRPRCGC